MLKEVRCDPQLGQAAAVGSIADRHLVVGQSKIREESQPITCNYVGAELCNEVASKSPAWVDRAEQECIVKLAIFGGFTKLARSQKQCCLSVGGPNSTRR